MNPKQKISGLIVFASVFVGSFLGAGITVITTPKEAAKGLQKKIKTTAEALKENVNEQLDSATVRLIENSTKLITKTKTTFTGVSTLLETLKDGFGSMLKKDS
ncbi:MAG: hypothetical protein HQL06_03995 [Nitrospirae bacterium]|nr:hypothetical protein [Nitrospirota bacterium]